MKVQVGMRILHEYENFTKTKTRTAENAHVRRLVLTIPRAHGCKCPATGEESEFENKMVLD